MRKFMKMHGAVHPKSDIDRVYLSREMGGRGLITCERCTRMEENKLGGMSGIQLSHRLKV